jgi:flagellar hook assembly protein FlgD
MMASGSHEVIWNGKNSSGIDVASGIYFYQLKADNNSKIRKMVMLK